MSAHHARRVLAGSEPPSEAKHHTWMIESTKPFQGSTQREGQAGAQLVNHQGRPPERPEFITGAQLSQIGEARLLSQDLGAMVGRVLR